MDYLRSFCLCASLGIWCAAFLVSRRACAFAAWASVHWTRTEESAFGMVRAACIISLANSFTQTDKTWQRVCILYCMKHKNHIVLQLDSNSQNRSHLYKLATAQAQLWSSWVCPALAIIHLEMAWAVVRLGSSSKLSHEPARAVFDDLVWVWDASCFEHVWWTRFWMMFQLPLQIKTFVTMTAKFSLPRIVPPLYSHFENWLSWGLGEKGIPPVCNNNFMWLQN